MVAVRATCMLIAVALFVQVFEIDSAPEPTIKPNTTTENPNGTDTTTATPPTTTTTSPIPTNTTTVPPPITTPPTTVNPNTTTVTPIPPNTTTTTTVTPAPGPPTPPTPITTVPTPITTAVPPTPTPCPNDRHFDTLSFMGGIILAGGLVAIGFVLLKFYKARTERNYHTL